MSAYMKWEHQEKIGNSKVARASVITGVFQTLQFVLIPFPPILCFIVEVCMGGFR